MKKWIKIDTIVQLGALLFGAVGLFTSLKASNEEASDINEKIDERIQNAYGLMPIKDDEEEES